MTKEISYIASLSRFCSRYGPLASIAFPFSYIVILSMCINDYWHYNNLLFNLSSVPISEIGIEEPSYENYEEYL
jgi:hypothetical protein